MDIKDPDILLPGSDQQPPVQLYILAILYHCISLNKQNKAFDFVSFKKQNIWFCLVYIVQGGKLDLYV